MSNITFIRHQQQTHHSLDPNIIDISEIPEYKYDIIICSPYRRCRETAIAFSKNGQTSIYVDIRISEFHGNKKIRGSFSDSTKEYLKYGEIPLHEDWENFTKRVDDFCNSLLPIKGNVLIVTHGIVVKYLEEKLLGTTTYKRGRHVPFMKGFTLDC